MDHILQITFNIAFSWNEVTAFDVITFSRTLHSYMLNTTFVSVPRWYVGCERTYEM